MRAYLLNPWALVQFAHNQAAALVTGTFAVTAVGAFYALRESHRDQARLYLKHGTVAGLAAAVLVAFPTGDWQAKIVARYQEPVLAAMEGRFETGPMAEITLIGQPNVKERRIDNPIKIPGVLSFLAYGTFHSDVRGLDAFPPETWPTNIELLYYAFHVMAGLGTMFIALMGLANIQRFRGRLEASPALLWVLMLAFPFPFIANTAGWMTTELGRQPWLIYGLFRTQDGYSDVVSSGDVLFTLIGLAGLYFVLGLLYLYLVGREILHGPDAGGASRRDMWIVNPSPRGARMVEVWFGLLCFTLIGVRGARRLGHRRGRAALDRRQDRRRAPRDRRRHRAALELARGVAAWRSAERSCSPSRKSWPPRSPGSISRSGSCSGRSSCAACPSRSAATSTTGCGDRGGTSCSPCRTCCSPCCSVPRSAT